MRFQFVSAAHLFLTQGDKILLSRRYNTGYEDGKYSVVAGHLDGGEQVKTAMIREAREEIGIKIQEINLRVVQVMHRLSSDERIDFFLHADRWEGIISNMEPDKCDHLAWFPIHQLPKNLIPYIRIAIQNFQQGIWFDSFGFPEK
jgi:8-oxo-dGTP diphosphatase